MSRHPIAPTAPTAHTCYNSQIVDTTSVKSISLCLTLSYIASNNYLAKESYCSGSSKGIRTPACLSAKSLIKHINYYLAYYLLHFTFLVLGAILTNKTIAPWVPCPPSSHSFPSFLCPLLLIAASDRWIVSPIETELFIFVDYCNGFFSFAPKKTPKFWPRFGQLVAVIRLKARAGAQMAEKQTRVCHVDL